ncbi:MAG: HIT family protein [Clostridiaceae bacterium]|nr:HIT family protein [Clostridiaceae bacterium]
MAACAICNIIDYLHGKEKDFFIMELETGYAVVSNRWQYFKGYTLFVCKKCVSELHELPVDYRQKYLLEMSYVAQAVFNAFKPNKLNYELLGNRCGHLHWHIIPRYGTDPKPNKPIWEIDRNIFDNKILDSGIEAKEIRDRILLELQKILNS